ncbi:MAG: bifunctional UDP-N-acetylglucosamine diphosphorylase/glucosamine-1-phosphate N-acetyltransferase GlmU, partial [Candidatus Gastranaerophilales bacterium]|nr:bifunctional UDP-N-acetylglucosamine diphosphorylase/glucosamine-1-phosphate N-acetyltransferase GlmU [Candidatus Gastranaerophilales bacterium]
NPLTRTKSKTVIGNDVKIGSNSVLVDPVVLDEGANVGAGGIITKDVPAWALAITRSPLKILENWVKKQLGK